MHYAKTLPFSFALPYVSQREAVMARNVVATSQPLAAQAGLHMLRSGGNAIDAAIATAIALTVVEPTSNGIGSDAFALVWAGGGLHGLNASGRSPANMLRENYAGKESISRIGWDGITTPGAVSAWVVLSSKFGSLPFEKLFEPAIHYARNGFHLSRQTAYYWNRGFQTYSRNDMQSWLHTFAPSGRAPVAGELVTLPDHAQTLESIATTKGESFYRGNLAQAMSQHAEESGGALRDSDLANHQPEWVRPIAMDYHGYELHEIPPNGQGLVALLAIGMLKYHRLDELPVDSVDSLHIQIEAMKLAFADGHRYIADPAAMDVTADDLLDASYLEERSGRIDVKEARDPQHGTPKDGGTVYLSTADADGNMVSYIQSNYTGFGSGVVVPKTGIAMQNRGCCFTLEEGHPNEVGPNKLPYHTIIPGFVTQNRDGEQSAPIMSFGVMGGFMQPQGHAQMMVRLILHRQNPQAALDAPRWRVEGGKKVVIEPGFEERLYDGLRERGHDVEIAKSRTVSHGGGQAVYRLENDSSELTGYFGASDLRRDGQAVGY